VGLNLNVIKWSYPTQIVNTSTRKDTRLAIGDDASATWKDDLELEFLRIDGFVQMDCDGKSFLLAMPIWYERLGDCKSLQLPRVRKYHTRDMKIKKGEPIPVHHLQEHVLAAHDCIGTSKGGAGPCKVTRVCHKHHEVKCGLCRTAVEYGEHLVHNKKRLEYHIVSKEDGFIKDSEVLNLDWMDKC